MSLAIIFWISLFGVIYTFVGYPVLLRLLNTLWAKDRAPSISEGSEAPSVSIVIVVWNGADLIRDRLKNLLSCKYEGKREIVVVCDGCDDETVVIAKSFEEDGSVKVVERESRSGKASGLNCGVERATGEIIVFADLRQRFDEDAIALLVAPMQQDPEIAAVSGNLEIERSEEGAGAGIDAYWKLEKWIRNEESILDSVIGCTGAIYALRRSSYVEIPQDTLIDDVVIPMQALVGGQRIVFEPRALAYDPQSLEPKRENRRKVRTLAGNYQMLFRYPSWLFPLRNRCWWQLISHKYLRLAGPLLLGTCLGCSFALAGDSLFFQVAAGLQTFCYVLAALGLIFSRLRWPVFTIPAGFLFLQWQSVRACFYYFTMRKGDGSW